MRRLMVMVPVGALLACHPQSGETGTIAVVQPVQPAAPAKPRFKTMDMPNVMRAGTGAPATDRMIGKWVGVEGLALTVLPHPSGQMGTYDLTVALMDGTSHYVGHAEGEAIGFDRGGQHERIRRVTGAETGLKWLADKRDCAMIKPGEGFCRVDESRPGQTE